MGDSFDVPVEQLLKASPDYFVNSVFNYLILPHHYNILDHIKNNQRSLDLAPRGTGKSRMLIGYAAWYAINQPDKRVLYLSDTDAHAMRFLATIKNTIESSELLRSVYGDIRNPKKWTEHEIVFKTRTKVFTEANITAYGMSSGGVTGGHYDLIVMDDICNFTSSRSDSQREKDKDWLKTSLMPTAMPGCEIHGVGCLPTNTPILLGDGSYKAIQDVLIGEHVYSFDRGELVTREVTDVIYQGSDDIYEVKTERSSVKTNSIHPFLVVSPTKLSQYDYRKYPIVRDFEYRWVKACDLCEGDLVVTVSEYDNEKSVFCSDFIKLFGVNPDFVWLFGFMVGDGWITVNNRNNGLTDKIYKTYKICFAEGDNKQLADKVLRIFHNLFGLKFGLGDNHVYMATSKKIGEYFVNRGLAHGAKNKVVPGWVFRLSLEDRKLFIRGLLDADGWAAYRKDGVNKIDNTSHRWHIESASEELVKGLKRLCGSCGYRTSMIYYRERIAQPPNSPKPILSKSWTMSILFYHNLPSMLHGKAKEKFCSDNFRVDRVVSVDRVCEDDIWDLTVDDTHNFIANGFVTHNTRYHYSDVWEEVIRLGFDTNIQRAIKEDGTSIWEKVLPLHDRVDNGVRTVGLDTIKNDLGRIIYNLQYMNDTALLMEGNIFQDKYIQYYDGIFFEDGKIFVQRENFRTEIKIIHIGVDLAISKTDAAAYTVVMVVGMGEDHKLYVLEVVRKKLTFHKQKEAILEMVVKWSPNSTRVESVAYQEAMVQELRAMGGLKIVGIHPTTDKVARANLITGWFENGNIYFLKSMIDLIDELLLFPDGVFKDQVDALVFSVDGFKSPSSEMVVISI